MPAATLFDLTEDARRLEATILETIDEGEVDFADQLIVFFDQLGDQI